uniref:Uncharacterized protein n=1 Tax=Catagonus wagneri TaxID=51154 RepID=A0A8C3YB99_9CETA
MGLEPLSGETMESLLSVFHGRMQREALCKPGRQPALEPHHAGTLISDFQPSELGENKFLFFKPSSLG